MKIIFKLMVAWAALSAGISLQAQPDYTSLFSVPASHSYVYREEMVPGGDGFHLLTRIYLPEGEGP